MMDFGILKRQIGIMNLMACGAREFVRLNENAIRFKVGSKPGVRCFLTVTLTPADTYTVERAECRKLNVKRETVEDVYCDNIGEVVRQMGDR